MFFHWSLSDNKSPQVSRTLLSILTVLNSAVVWTVAIRPPTSKSSRLFNNLLVTVTKALTKIGTVVTFKFHRLFNSLASQGTYPSFHILLVLFCGQPGLPSTKICKFSFFLFFCGIIIRSGLLVEIW